MKSFVANLVMAACALHGGSAFSSPAPASSSCSSTTARRTPLRAAALGRESSAAPAPAPSAPAAVPTARERRRLDAIRAELVAKYVALGHPEDYAAAEVQYFLADPGRSAQYVEMRRVALARGNDGNDLGIENAVGFVAAFAVGALASWALHSSASGLC